MFEALEQEVIKLQEKERQLKQIEVFCQQKKEKLLRQCDELTCFPKSTSKISLDDQGMRNGCEDKHYLEVVELLTQIHCLEERKEELTFHVKNSAAEKKRHEVSQALKDNQNLLHRLQKMHRKGCFNLLPLERWHLQMLQCDENATECETTIQLSNNKKRERLKVPDVPVYNVTYDQDNKSDALMLKRATQTITTATRAHEEDMKMRKYQLSFMTRRNGICVHILIVAQIEGKSSNHLPATGGRTETAESSEMQVTLNDTLYTVITDPYVSGISEKGIDALQQELHSIKFVKEILWPEIDRSFEKS